MQIQNELLQIIVLMFMFVFNAEGPAISSVSLQNVGFLQRNVLTNISRNNRNQLIPFGINIRKQNNFVKPERRIAVSNLSSLQNIFRRMCD